MYYKNIDAFSTLKTAILDSKLALFKPIKQSNSSRWWMEKSGNIFSTLEKSKNFSFFFEQIQKNSISGFDHRIHSNDVDDLIGILMYKEEKLKKFNCCNSTNKLLGESKYSAKTSVVSINNIPLSNIFQSHLSHYFRIKEQIPSFRNIIEIGAGYGSLARIFLEKESLFRYVIVDLPSSLVCSYLFLKANFPDLKIIHTDLDGYVNTNDFNFSNQTVVILISSENLKLLKILKIHFDLAINTGSFQEMPHETVCMYFKLLLNNLKVKYLYSNNYFLNPELLGNESERNLKVKPLVPKLNIYYKITWAMLNNPVYDIDASSRNWLEIIAKRTSDSTITADCNKPLIRALKSIAYKDRTSFFDIAYSYTYFLFFYIGFPKKLDGSYIYNNLLGMKKCIPLPTVKFVELRELLSKVNRLNILPRLVMRCYISFLYLLVSPFALIYFAILSRKVAFRKGLPPASSIRMSEFKFFNR